MRHHRVLPHSSTQQHTIYTIVLIGFIYTFHLVLPTYSSSSFLSLFASERSVGFIYMTSAALTALGFLCIPSILRRVGNYITVLWLILIQIGLVYGLTVTTDPIFIALFFILQTAVIALVGFCIDVFLEIYSSEKMVGMIRGMYLTTMNSAWVIAPLVGTMIIGAENDYRGVYTSALFMLIPLFYLIYKNFSKFTDPHYHHPSLWHTLMHIIKKSDHLNLFIANTTLQVFYAWMVVYSPIYLNTVIGLSWTEIGLILTIMLLPFPLLQWPLGKLADRKYGEKEIMIIGFALLGLSTIALAGIVSKSVFIWALALFITRIGAASAEVMIETYFFKTTDTKDPNLLGFFRITRSISYFIAPLITGFVFLFTTDQSYLFITLGLLCLIALIPVWGLKDTR